MLVSRASRFLQRKFQALLPVRAVLEWEFERHFATAPVRLFRGVYGSFAEATERAPKTAGIGFDQPQPAQMYNRRFHWIFPSDYPVMLWLARAFRDGARVFDYGGNVGISFYSFSKYMDYPAALRWTVCDLPAVTAEGEKLAREQNAAGLDFTNAFAEADGADILLASGALQYVETPFAENLASLARKPRHLLINRVPLREGKSFVTLQSVGGAFCPYHIFNAADFIASISALGYEMIDGWENPDFPCEIPFHPPESVRAMSGLYFQLAEKK